MVENLDAKFLATKSSDGPPFKRECSYNFEHLLYTFLGVCILFFQYSSFEVKINMEHINCNFAESDTPKWPPLFQGISVIFSKFEY